MKKQYRYEIDENNAVRVWDITGPSDDNEPFIIQPFHPEKGAWTKEEAELWVNETFINQPDIPEDPA